MASTADLDQLAAACASIAWVLSLASECHRRDYLFTAPTKRCNVLKASVRLHHVCRPLDPQCYSWASVVHGTPRERYVANACYHMVAFRTTASTICVRWDPVVSTVGSPAECPMCWTLCFESTALPNHHRGSILPIDALPGLGNGARCQYRGTSLARGTKADAQEARESEKYPTFGHSFVPSLLCPAFCD